MLRLHALFSDKYKVKAFVSLGPTCVPAEILKASGLRSCSFGFDWARSGSVHLHNFMNFQFRTFLDSNILRPSIELDQFLSPAESGTNTGEVQVKKIKYGFQYYYNPHRDIRANETHEYLVRCFSRLSRVIADHRCEKVFVLADYVNKQHCVFLDNEGLSEFLEDTLESVAGNYSIKVIRLRLIHAIDFKDLLVTTDRKGAKTELINIDLASSCDDETVRNHTYRLVGKKIFGEYSQEMLWRI